MRLSALIPLALSVSACSAMSPGPDIVASPSPSWRSVATETDRERLRGWRDAFTSALAAARAAGHGDEIARQGALLDPDSALGGEPIPAGLYRCRVIKLGAKSQGMLDYVAYPWFRCQVREDDGRKVLAKLSGSQRHVGRIFAGDALREIFLGTLMLGDEERAMQYGVDPDRDVAGFVERIGPQRWRLVMPWPNFESRLDVMELVPEN